MITSKAVGDYCVLQKSSDPDVLTVLRERFNEGYMYTAVGPSVLLAINPFQLDKVSAPPRAL